VIIKLYITYHLLREPETAIEGYQIKLGHSWHDRNKKLRVLDFMFVDRG